MAILYNVGEFNGDTSRSDKDFQRAVDGLDAIKKYVGAVESKLKAKTGFNPVHMPTGTQVMTYGRGDVEVEIKSFKGTKKPAYKGIASGMTSRLAGMELVLDQGRVITGVRKYDGLWFAGVPDMLESYDILVAEHMIPAINHRFSIDSPFEANTIDQVPLPDEPNINTIADMQSYAQAKALKPVLEAFAKAYKAALPEGSTKTTTKTARTKKTVEAQQADWKYVVQSVVTVPTNTDYLGLLNALDDPSQIDDSEQSIESTLAELTDGLDIVRDERRGRQIPFIGLRSLYGRINELRDESLEDKTRVHVGLRRNV